MRPLANAQTHTDHLLRRTGLATPKNSNVDRFIQRVADDLFTRPKAADSVNLKRIGTKPTREIYVERIATSALFNFELENTAPLLNILQQPVEPFAVQVE